MGCGEAVGEEEALDTAARRLGIDEVGAVDNTEEGLSGGLESSFRRWSKGRDVAYLWQKQAWVSMTFTERTRYDVLRCCENRD